MKDYDIVLASGAEHLRTRFEELGYRVFTCDLNYDNKRVFPNEDLYVRIADVAKLADRRVVVIQSCTGAGPAEEEHLSTSDRLTELLLILDVLNRPVEVEEIGHKKYKATPLVPPSRVEVVLSFQPFALQDKAFKTGEAVSSRWAMDLIAKSCNKIWVINPHASDTIPWMANLIKRGLIEVLDITPDLIKFGAEQFGFDNYVVITPDEGGQERFSVEGFGKSRSDSFSVELTGSLEVENKQVIIVDDLTKSGGTLLKAAERLKSQGAEDVGFAVAHVLPIREKGESLLERLVEKSGEKIVTSNTIRTHTFCEQRPHLTYNIVDTLVRVL
ncbi:MAG: hypothetical protein K9W43_03410 [Candidatus Thorarchaeota archaeon]|nr:hypothetical protein [Candidatus Thorarchaeota archaeon]